MIITAQPFFNELDLLEIKCSELRGVVDLHVIVEAPITFTGLPKPLYFAANKARFEQFPIIHVVCELQPEVKSPWERERRQHEFVREAVRALKPEIVMYLDADELPRHDTVDRFRRMKRPAAHVDMDWITFFFDRIDTSRRPTTARIWKFDQRESWGPWRGDKLDENPATVIANSGWHFDYFNFGEQFLVEKLKAISHAADENGDAMLRTVMAGGIPGFERTTDYPISKLPRFVRENWKRWPNNFYR